MATKGKMCNVRKNYKFKFTGSGCLIITAGIKPSNGRNKSYLFTCFEYGRPEYLHRYVYRKCHRLESIPVGCDVHHVCENPQCFNPRHLVLLKKGVHKSLSHKLTKLGKTIFKDLNTAIGRKKAKDSIFVCYPL